MPGNGKQTTNMACEGGAAMSEETPLSVALDMYETRQPVSATGKALIWSRDRIAELERRLADAARLLRAQGRELGEHDAQQPTASDENLVMVSADRMRTWAAMLSEDIPGKNLARLQVREDILAALTEKGEP